MERDLDKLGTVLATQNGIIREALDMLREQQKRQVRIIWASLFIIAMAIIVTGATIFCAYNSFDKLAHQVNMNTQLSVHNAEVIQNAHIEEKSETVPE